MPASMPPAAMSPATRWFACWAEPHCASTVLHAVVYGSTSFPADSHALRVTLLPCSPAWVTQPPTTSSTEPASSDMGRGKQAVAIGLKQPDGVEALVRLMEQADAFFEVFRPGVAERLGIGPEAALDRNPRLVYGRLTGWGQDGPYAQAAGHDINYIALAGALAHFGRADSKPTPPINLVGDFGGGGMVMAFGIVCGVLGAPRSGQGQGIDVAMVDGTAILMSMMWGLKQLGVWKEQHGTNVLDTGAPFYDTYETSDGKFVSLGSLEPQFYAELMRRLDLDAEGLSAA